MTAGGAAARGLTTPRIRIFTSYCHADESYREQLETRLKGIQRLLPIDLARKRGPLPS